MHLLSLAVRRFLEGSFLLLGGLLTLASCWFAVFTITTPGCAVDADDEGAVLVVRLFSGGWIVAALICLGVVISAYRRSSGDGWNRVLLAAALPLGAFVVWLVSAGVTTMVLDLMGAGGGSSACV